MKPNIFIYIFLFLLVVSSCGDGSSVDDDATYSDTLTHHATYLNLARRPDGVLLVDIKSPWNSDKILARYAFVDRDSVLPENLPQDINIIRTPVQRAAVFSSVHTSLMDELGVLSSLSAIADAVYFPKNDTVKTMLAENRIVDLGNASAPSIERLAVSGTEVVLRSPMKDVSAAALPPGIHSIECADYMESTPIGRAEWMLLYGELFGVGDKARAVFEEVIDEYSRLVFKAGASSVPKPKILVETETSGVWYVPAGQSYAARIYADAGADYPWKDSDGQGSLALSLEEVASKALDADMWLVRSYGYETTPATLLKLNPRYGAFAALKNGNVYSCNTESRNVFGATSFHPEILLAEYISIFHPDVMPDSIPRFFIK